MTVSAILGTNARLQPHTAPIKPHKPVPPHVTAASGTPAELKQVQALHTGHQTPRGRIVNVVV